MVVVILRISVYFLYQRPCTMRVAWWLVVGLALVSDVITDSSTDDPEGDGVLGENVDESQVLVQEGLIANSRRENDPECVLLESTEIQPTKFLLDRTANIQCNNFEREEYGTCNCPENYDCKYEGQVEEARVYYCRDHHNLPSANDQYGDGLILGEMEDPLVYIIEGSDRK